MIIRKIIPPKGWKCRIITGNCDISGRKFKSAYAHAHNNTGKAYLECFGLLCFSSLKYLGKYDKIKHKDGSYTLKIIKAGHYLKHEYAHILTPNEGHTKKWLINLKKIGGRTKGYTNKNGNVRGWKE